MFGVVILAILVGSGYETVERRHDDARLPRIGRAVDIGGRSLNIYCSGTGRPAVVFDSGAGTPGYAWSDIQAQVAETTLACWYDRAGEGWSDPGRFPRTSAAIASDLHTLLQRAGVAPPYVLVGASFGGLNVRVYNGLYPAEVAGMVLVDSAHEDEPTRAPAAYRGHTMPRLLWSPFHVAMASAARVGLIRLLGAPPTVPDDLSRATREQILDTLRERPEAIVTRSDPSAPESYAEAHAAAGLGDRPLIVLTRGRSPAPTGDAGTDHEIAAYEQIWIHEIQAQLVRLSTRGRQIVVATSGHRIPDEAPDIVVSAVREVVRQARSGPPRPHASR
jgi:pimeloyl-ACP methyl ester carboxylesterase